jgi:hypothetical protein
VEAIVRSALVLCSRHPFSDVYTTTAAKVEAMTVHLTLHDPDRLQERLRKCVPAQRCLLLLLTRPDQGWSAAQARRPKLGTGHACAGAAAS